MEFAMGIYGALSTAVTGLRAQAYSLENISGNIANSQTTGFKRIDTDFIDLVPDSATQTQTSGSVLARSNATNSIQGDIRSVETETNMAINGDGFFVVEPAIGQADGEAVFAGSSYYTRRGDFDVDKNGYLVNGSGYYLKGLPIDSATGNISGSVPQVLQISNAFLPAQQSTKISYQLNLPQLPKTAAYNESQSTGSELFDASDFMSLTPDTAATIGGGAATSGAASSIFASDGDSLTVGVGAASITYTFTNTGGSAGTVIDTSDPATDTIDEVLALIQSDLVTAGATGATVGIVGSNIRVTAGNTTDAVTVSDATTGFGFVSGTANASVSTAVTQAARVSTIAAEDEAEFLDQSVSGSAITVYAENGAPANVQMRWVKISSSEVGGVDRWNLFYRSDSNATGGDPMWTNVGVDYTFGSDGSLNPPITETELNNLTVNGVNVGNVTLSHGTSGVTQFNDPNGAAEVTKLSQNGFPAGEFLSVSINDNGRIVASYTNGQQVEVAQVVTANFNAANQLKRMDGGIFAATSESGEPIYNTNGGVIGAALEASNTDISEEFTKLIVTQQAYSASTRIVSTADQMLQEALNMIR